MNTTEQASIRCMLLPMSKEMLLMPSSAIAEIVGFTQPVAVQTKNDWFLGLISWRGVSVPLLSIDRLCEFNQTSVNSKSRIAIIYNPHDDPQMSYVGVQIEGTPRAFLADSDELPQGETDGLNRFMIARVETDGGSCLLPNLDVILAKLKSELKVVQSAS